MVNKRAEITGVKTEGTITFYPTGPTKVKVEGFEIDAQSDYPTHIYEHHILEVEDGES